MDINHTEMKMSSFLPSIYSSVQVFQKTGKISKNVLFFGRNSSSSAIISSALILILITVISLPHNRYFSAQAFNDEKGILKWNPYWFTNFRYSAPTSFYISPNRVGTPYKRVSEPAGISGVYGGSTYGSGSSSIYKWSPVYFSSGSYSSSSTPGLHQPSSFYNYGSGTTGLGGGGYMYSPNRPRWSLSDYGGSRFLTRYYGGNSFIPSAVPRSNDGGLAVEASGIDLAGSNDLSALLGDELMNNGLGLENDRIDILDGESDGQRQTQEQRSH